MSNLDELFRLEQQDAEAAFQLFVYLPSDAGHVDATIDILPDGRVRWSLDTSDVRLKDALEACGHVVQIGGCR